MRVTSTFLALLLVLSGARAAADPVYFEADAWDNINGLDLQSTQPRRLEAVLGRDTHEKVAKYNERAFFRAYSKPVGRLDFQFENGIGGSCTAFLVAKDVALTNYHCIPGFPSSTSKNGRVVKARLLLNYLEVSTDPEIFMVDVTPIGGDATLDYSLIRVRGQPGERFGMVDFAAEDPQAGDVLWVAHHPGRAVKYVTRGDCRASDPTATNKAVLFHRCDTLPGSSGAPIFSQNNEVVAIHRAGASFDTIDETNFGVLATAIDVDLREIRRLDGTVLEGLGAGEAEGHSEVPTTEILPDCFDESEWLLGLRVKSACLTSDSISLNANEVDALGLRKISFFGNLRNLNLRSLEFDDLNELPQMPHLSHLSIADTNIRDIEAIGRKFPNLKSIYLNGTGVNDFAPLELLKSLHYVQLPTGEVVGSYEETGDGKEAVQRWISRWKLLSDGGCLVAGDVGLNVGGGCVSFQVTSIDSKEFPDFDLQRLTALTSLRELILRQDQGNQLASIKLLPSIESLALRDSNFRDLRHLPEMPSLEKLFLNRTRAFNFGELKRFPSLHYVQLPGGAIVGAYSDADNGQRLVADWLSRF